MNLHFFFMGWPKMMDSSVIVLRNVIFEYYYIVLLPTICLLYSTILISWSHKKKKCITVLYCFLQRRQKYDIWNRILASAFVPWLDSLDQNVECPTMPVMHRVHPPKNGQIISFARALKGHISNIFPTRNISSVISPAIFWFLLLVKTLQ